MLISIWSRISRLLNELLKARQDQYLRNKDLERGKETMSHVPNVPCSKCPMLKMSHAQNVLFSQCPIP